MSALYQILPPDALPFGLLAIGEQFQTIDDNGIPGVGTYLKIEADIARVANNDNGVRFRPFELVRPVAPAPGDNTTIVEDIRRQPAPVCVCSNCAGLLDPGECGCLCRVCATAGATPRPRPIRRYTLILCPCCASTVGTMDRWCATCGQPLYAPQGVGVPF